MRYCATYSATVHLHLVIWVAELRHNKLMVTEQRNLQETEAQGCSLVLLTPAQHMAPVAKKL